ncbi:legume-like lectin family-domain-containing protein [Syncephalis pseudoplumigaleata]|uniref:Legume-like lectin family-domain-containing protein n=1 Tax=Syncephalis pseudoplumigaleata TaxID=1712513 RepID=A0A4P9YYA6_9FUNG|nr:legume-like lectin family-domain-containing protein [Syncephalis pseudoplumigaleata]|eukprot:RKP24905.1 legume-like lectin family-domain-containing protein [Syncephalis pseudoplumigaleata]
MRCFTALGALALSLQALTVATAATEEETQDLRIRYWDYGGDAIIDANNHIRLTPEFPSRRGWIWSKLVEFEFKVHGSHHIYGDGFAMWATKDRTDEGPVFGNKDFVNGLGVIFDTYMNSNTDHYYPYVMAMLGDGRTPYDEANDGRANQIGGCESSFRNVEHATRARVTYYKGSQLKVELLVANEQNYETCFVLNQNITLPTPAYLGFTAHTGDVSDNHDITWVSSHELHTKPAAFVTPPPYGAQPPSGSALGFFFKLVLFSVICGVGVIGYRMYQNQGNKRF